MWILFFAPHPPCPLLPHGEKGELGRPETLWPLIPPPSSPTRSRADRTFEQRCVFWRYNGQSVLTPHSSPALRERDESGASLLRCDAV